MMKTLLKVCLGALALLLVFMVGLFVAMSVFDSPGYAWRVLALMRSDTNDYRVFPSRPIENGPTVSTIERDGHGTPHEITYPYSDGMRTEILEDLLKRTDTRAFLILKDDQLIFETYLDSFRTELNTSFSVAKSFGSALIGAAIADGAIESVDDPVIKYVPEIAGRGLDTLTIRNLLRMDTGIRYRNEDEIIAPLSDDGPTYYSPDLRHVAFRVQPSDTPVGAAFHYNNFHPLLEGLIGDPDVSWPFVIRSLMNAMP